MNNEQYEALLAAINTLETEVNLRQAKLREYIDKAFEYNALTRQERSAITALQKELAPLVQQRDVIVAEMKRQLAEKHRAEAEAAQKAREETAKAEAEAKAKEASEVEFLRARVAELEAAKG